MSYSYVLLNLEVCSGTLKRMVWYFEKGDVYFEEDCVVL